MSERQFALGPGPGPAARTLCLVAVGLILVTMLFASGGFLSLFLVLFTAWALVPFGVFWLLSSRVPDPWAQTAAAVALLLAEIYTRAWVFVVPNGSTVPLLLLFSPIYLSVIVLPVGLGAGWALGRLWRNAPVVGRGAIVATGITAAVLVALVVFRPGALPARVGSLVSTRASIGPPRIVVGAESVTKVRLSPKPTWYQAGAFDGSGKVAVAAIDARGATLLDPTTGAQTGTITFSQQAWQQWNWFSRLVHDGSELVIVQTGGGYSEVEVLDLSGRRRWQFRPDPALPPIALVPRDLDGDGRPEFYAASNDSVYRLDAAGRIVWQRTVKGRVDALDALAAHDGRPGLLVGVAIDGHVWTWDAEGRAQHQFTLPRGEYRYRLLDGPQGHVLVGGTSTLRVFDLQGRGVFEHRLGDFRYADAAAVRLDSAGPVHLAVVAAAPRSIGQWRLLVFDAAGILVYDEILPHGARLVGPPGLLVSDGTGLVAYRK